MFATPAFAASANSAASAGGSTAAIFMQLFPLIMIGLVGWFLLIRPQAQRQKQHQARIASVKKGDSVITAGGVLGKVTKVEEQYVELEIAPSVKIRVVKATLTEVNGAGGAKPAND